jgi:hypothetical protein
MRFARTSVFKRPAFRKSARLRISRQSRNSEPTVLTKRSAIAFDGPPSRVDLTGEGRREARGDRRRGYASVRIAAGYTACG